MDHRQLVVVVLLVLCAAGVLCRKPNIVFILTDDQDVTMGGQTPMTNTLAMIGKKGMTFQNMFTVSPLCCPSRSSILTGNYVHNHQAINNSIAGNCSSTNWQNGPEKNTFATHLKQLGYKTFFAGKYLNQYGDKAVGGVAHIPPGWDEWHGLVHNSVYYNYTLSVNGKAEVHGDDYEKDYLTDIINNRSHEFIARQTVLSAPFFVMVSTPACHSPFDSAPQYTNEFADKKAPRDASFNKAGTDKHWLIRHAPNPLSNGSLTYIDDTFRKRWRTLLSVDDMVKNIITTLDSMKMLDNTFIIFSSDNGFHLGQFSLPNDKRQLYEFDIRVPLMIRGPEIPANTVSKELVLNMDIMPTIVQLAGGTAPSNVDGMSLVPLLKTGETGKWRESGLISHSGQYNPKGNVQGCPNTEFLDIPKSGSTEQWRSEILIEHNGEYAPKGYTGCKDTKYLNLPKGGVGSKVQTYLGSSTVPWRNAILVEHQGEYRRNGDYGCTNADFLCDCHPSCVCEDAINNTYSCRRVIKNSANTMYCEFSDSETCYPSCVCEDGLNNTYSCRRVIKNSANTMYCEFSDSEACYPSCVCEDGLNNTYSCRRVLSQSANTMYCEFSDSESCRPSCVCEDAINNTYSCIRTLRAADDFIYCIFEDDENFQEFYNLTADPHQLTNMIKKMTPEFLAEQNKQLIKLSVCKGASCREVHPPGEQDDSHHQEEGNSVYDQRSNKILSNKKMDNLENRILKDKNVVMV